MSLTRALQYEVLRTLQFRGALLDVGGGERSSYRAWLNCEDYHSLNIDPTPKPTWITKPGEEWPCPENSFDTVLSMNTLEHIFDAADTLRRMRQVLKGGGQAVLATPFLFPVHGAPNDYFRPTPSWYREALADVGFVNIEIVSIAWGPFSTGLTCSGTPGPLKGIRRQTALFLDLLYACRLAPQPYAERMESFAAGFFVRALAPA